VGGYCPQQGGPVSWAIVTELIHTFRNQLRKLKSRIEEFDFETVDPELSRIAHEAYDKCASWYGAPFDTHARVTVVRGPISAASYDFWRREYVIVISSAYDSHEDIARSVSHEMYHRFTLRTRGIHRRTWLSETLAFLTSVRFLECRGHNEYVRLLRQAVEEDSAELSLDELKAVRRRRFRGLLSGRMYPLGYSHSIGKIAFRLDAMLQWEHICSLVSFHGWDQWLASLPEASVADVRRLLEI
jgi:hypothetical protein